MTFAMLGRQRTRRAVSLTIPILTGVDDGGQSADGTTYWNTIDNYVPFASNTAAADRRVGGFRFAAAIPQGATITAATFTAFMIDNKNDDINADVYVEDLDSAPNYSGSGPNGRTAYAAAGAAWFSLGTSTAVRAVSPSIVAGVQAVVNRAGWVSGNYIGILIRGRSDANYIAAVKSYDHPDAATPELNVTYLA